MNKILGYKISAERLQDPLLFPTEPPCLWLIMDKDFVTNDGLPHFYLDEIPLLRDKTVEQLREIYNTKKAFLGARMRR